MKNYEVIYTVECMPEDMPISGNVLASGDDAEDHAAEQLVREQLQAGNEWAWCCVKVTARIDGIDLAGVDYLGGCSYESEQDFVRCDYFADMKSQARRDLMAQVETMREALKKLEEVQS